MTLLPQDEKLALAAYLEKHSEFTLPASAKDLDQALQALDQNYLNQNTTASRYSEQYARLKNYFRTSMLVLLLISFVIGLLVTPSSFLVNEQKHINIYWLLLTLLGLPCINLFLWLASMVWLTSKASSSKRPFLLATVSFLHHKISQWLAIDVQVSKAFWHWQSPPQNQTWLASSLSHGVWLSYLSAGLLMTLLLLLTNQVSFIWETTLLSDSRFLSLTQWLSTPLDWLGLDLPTQADILSSRIDHTLQEQGTRQRWANFLLASLFVYGLLPRLFLLILCMAVYRFKLLNRKPSIQEQVILNRYVQQEAHKKRIIDPDHLKRPQNTDYEKQTLPVCPIEKNSLWGLYEWSDEIPATLKEVNAYLVNDQSQQHAFLPLTHGQATYLLVNNAHSPDRGTMRFLTNLAAQQASVQMVLSKNKTSHFDAVWLDLAKQLQLAEPKYLPEE
ncbi:DUF2868 domain-containing protein [Marinomonas sp. THO17]|uniref:DUF2868 domain-containing protein n=1 Tax=Marinomonas sp. THO17 TaxID=3149048 RepID=UPI00336C160C